MKRFLATSVGVLVPVVLIAGPAAAGGNGDGGQTTGTQNSQGANQSLQHIRGDSWDWTVQGR
ncbi:MAG: hypothetical protein IPH03_10460 [Tetrasphaera sp.]|jgi:hypothetical protein|nr:hypothetical protein [Tetrasphaera sp.]